MMNLTFSDWGLTYYAYFYAFILLCFIGTSYIVIYINCGFGRVVLMLSSPGIRIDLLYGYINIKLLWKFQIHLMVSGANPLNTAHPSDAYP